MADAGFPRRRVPTPEGHTVDLQITLTIRKLGLSTMLTILQLWLKYLYISWSESLTIHQSIRYVTTDPERIPRKCPDLVLDRKILTVIPYSTLVIIFRSNEPCIMLIKAKPYRPLTNPEKRCLTEIKKRLHRIKNQINHSELYIIKITNKNNKNANISFSSTWEGRQLGKVTNSSDWWFTDEYLWNIVVEGIWETMNTSRVTTL